MGEEFYDGEWVLGNMVAGDEQRDYAAEVREGGEELFAKVMSLAEMEDWEAEALIRDGVRNGYRDAIEPEWRILEDGPNRLVVYIPSWEMLNSRDLDALLFAANRRLIIRRDEGDERGARQGND